MQPDAKKQATILPNKQRNALAFTQNYLYNSIAQLTK